MTLIVEETYPAGVPQTAVLNFAPTGCAWHWSAGGPGRAGWEGTIRHLVNTRATVNASYHGGLWHEHAADLRCRTVIQWIVPTTRAAHSMAPASAFRVNPNKDRASQDARFAEVRRILAAKASDPNAGCIAIAYAGMPADLARDFACSTFRADVRDLAAQLVAHPNVIDRPHFGHGWIQPIDRYEMDAPAADFISMLYATGDPVREEDMPTPALHYVPQLWKANAGGAELREQADVAAPVISIVPAGTVMLTLGEAQSDRQGWRLALAGDPERLYFVRRAQITAMPPTPRDAALYDGIATVVNARAAGQPVPSGGVPQADYDALAAQVAAMTKRIGDKDRYIAGYPKG